MEYILFKSISYACIDFTPFNQWCSDYSWIVTFISIIASGVISLIISRLYYNKSNRIFAITSVVEEICKIINKPISQKNSIEFKIRKNLYGMNFLGAKEILCINNLYDSYEALLGYDAEQVAADAIVEWYHKMLIANGTNIYIEPIKDNEGNVIASNIPSAASIELSDLIYDNLNVWYDYQINSHTEKKINKILRSTSKRVFGSDKITDYFFGTSFEKVVESYENDRWGERFKTYHSNREKFYQTFSKIRMFSNKI